MNRLALALIPALFLAAAAPAHAAETTDPVQTALDAAWHVDSGNPLADLVGPAALERGGGGRRRGRGGDGGDGGDGGGRRRGGDGGDGGGDGQGDRPTREEILQKYDANGNGRLDAEEREALQRDRRARRGGDGEGGRRRRRGQGGGGGGGGDGGGR